MVDFVLHIDRNLLMITEQYGALVYLILWAIVFMETGLVITPFLPGDSLIFAAGAIAAGGGLNMGVLWLVLIVAAFLGDTVNYWIGNYIGPKAFEMNYRMLKREYLEKAQKFYEKHGGKAIVLARFVPIVRTFAPFVAGVGTMSYRIFLGFNLLGGVVWVTLFLLSGYFFGRIPVIKDNFHYTVMVIVLISVLPIGWEYLKSRKEKN